MSHCTHLHYRPLCSTSSDLKHNGALITSHYLIGDALASTLQTCLLLIINCLSMGGKLYSIKNKKQRVCIR